jgi:3-oxoacyl-[acyl-carrier protein] reductase
LDLEIAGKTALVTGASKGIGRGIALALGAEGVRLAIVARRRELLEEVVGELAEAGAPSPVVIDQDLMREEAPAEIAAAALDGLGPVDILVNNAGGSRQFGLDATEEKWEEAITLNFTRPRQLTHRLLGQMIDRGWGRIIKHTF